MRILHAVWLVAALTSSHPGSASTPAWTGQWEIVADPLTAYGLAGLPDSICGSDCTIRDTWRGVSIDRTSIFELTLPDVLSPASTGRPAPAGAGWTIARSGDVLTITGADGSAGAAPGAQTRYILSLRGEFLQVEMTQLGFVEPPPPVTLLYRRVYTDAPAFPRR